MAPLPRNGPQRSGHSASTMLGFMPPSFSPRKRGPRGHDGAAATERTSAQWAFRRRGVRVLLKRKHPLCRGGCGGSMSVWLPSSAPWSLGPGPRLFCRGGKTRGRKARGPGTAMWPLSRNGPQRSGPSAGTMSGLPPCSFPPRKRGPRNRGGAAATERTSAQWAFRRRGVRVLLKRKHPLCRGGCGDSMSVWLPSRTRWSLGPGLRRENDKRDRR